MARELLTVVKGGSKTRLRKTYRLSGRALLVVEIRIRGRSEGGGFTLGDWPLRSVIKEGDAETGTPYLR